MRALLRRIRRPVKQHCTFSGSGAACGIWSFCTGVDVGVDVDVDVGVSVDVAWFQCAFNSRTHVVLRA